VRWEQDWPLPDTEYRPLFLSSDGLVKTCPQIASEVHYDMRGAAEFRLTFSEDTVLSGHVKLRLWLEARGDTPDETPNDMIVCCFLDKRDVNGQPVRFNGTIGSENDLLSRGYLRVSRRALDAARSTEWLPVLDGRTVQELTDGQIVPVEIPFCPIATFFSAGESLHVIVSPRELVHAPVFGKDTSLNKGLHVLHFGGEYDAHLLVPIIPHD